MKKRPKPVDPSKLPSATLLAFAKPLLAQLPAPPTATSLQAVMNITTVVWNMHIYEKSRNPKSEEFRIGLELALSRMPPEGKATIASMMETRATTYVDDPRLAFAEVVADPSGNGEVRATAFLPEEPPAHRG